MCCARWAGTGPAWSISMGELPHLPLPHPLARQRAFHVMAKPIGPRCNLRCAYCFYLEKDHLYPGERSFRMSDETLESFIRQYIEAQEVPEVSFAWQGGEPTLLGIEFFRRVVELQRKYLPPGMRLINALQTNGTLLDAEWCRFLRENNFLVGISIDGPRELHDHFRQDAKGGPSFEHTLRGLRLMREHGVEFNVLCVVNRVNSQHPLECYRFFKEEGVRFIQFIPIVERLAEEAPCLGAAPSTRDVSEASVLPEEYGRFLCEIYDEWVRNDVGKVYIQTFEVAFSAWLGHRAGLCAFEPTCGTALALEHNGDLYSCDHYVYPEYYLGNVMEQPLVELVESTFQREFGTSKRDALPRVCRECEVRFLCNGCCPKNRFLRTPAGEEGLNYLCAGLKRFFTHIGPTMEWMAQAFSQGRPPAGVMDALRKGGPGVAGAAPAVRKPERPEHRDAARGAAPGTIGRNSPCPCGSGKKYKRCCGA